jgi:hypothetical protein
MRSPLVLGLFLPIVSLDTGCRPNRDANGQRPDTGTTRVADTPRTALPSDTPVARYADSAGFFNPGGFYTPEDEVPLEDEVLRWVKVHVADYYYDGQLHFDRPRLVIPPEITVASSAAGAEGATEHQCVETVVKPDSLSARCITDRFGELFLSGQFLDKAGKYSSKPAYESEPTVLLVARVVIRKGGSVVHDAVHRFRYSTGD